MYGSGSMELVTTLGSSIKDHRLLIALLIACADISCQIFTDILS